MVEAQLNRTLVLHLEILIKVPWPVKKEKYKLKPKQMEEKNKVKTQLKKFLDT